MKAHFRNNDHICGPFDYGQIIGWRNAGIITGDIWVKTEKSDNWVKLDSTTEHELNREAEASAATPFTREIGLLSEKIRELRKRIDDHYATHTVCRRCGTSAGVYLDFIERPGPGFLISNGHGLAMFRQTTNTEWVICCRNCGTRVYGLEAVRKYENELTLQQKRMTQLERRAKHWRSLRQLSVEHPYTAAIRAFFAGLPSPQWQQKVATNP